MLSDILTLLSFSKFKDDLMCFEGVKVLVRLLYVKIILITKYYH
jgi:hypothetical protein